MALTYRSSGAVVPGSTANSFAGLAIGTADPARKLLICVIGLKTSAAALPSSVTVDGSPATMLGTGALLTDSTNHASDHSAWIIDWPTGATATIAVNYAAAVAGVIAAVYELSGTNSYTLAAENSGSASPISFNMSVLAGDFIFGLLARRSSNLRRGNVAHSIALSNNASYNIGATSGAFTAGVTSDVESDISANATGTRATCYGFVLRTTIDQVTGVSPNTGVLGDPVTVSGNGFTNATGVTFDGVSATSVVVVNDTTITCDVPAGTGTVDVTVERPTGDLTLAGAFTYTAAVIDQVTQAAVLVVTYADQGVKVTQAPVLVATLPKPLPKPFPLVPDSPLTEIWRWKTTVAIAENSREDRIVLTEYPRLRLSLDVTLTTDAERLTATNLIVRNLGEIFYYPLYQYAVRPDAAATAGDTRLYFDVDVTDIRDAEALAILDVSTNKTYVYPIANMEVDGATLSEPLAVNMPIYWLITPAIIFRFDRSVVGYTMRALIGKLKVDLEANTPRQIERPGQIASPTLLDGTLLLDIRPLSNEGVPNNYTQQITWINNDIAPAQSYTGWRHAAVFSTRQYLVNRPEDMDYWRAVAELIQGRKNTFLVPTFRNDLPVASQPALDAMSIVSTNFHFFDYYQSQAYKYVRIQSDAGEIYRRITNVSANYDANGDAVSVNVFFDSSIGSDPGSNDNMIISFVNTCRLDRDEISLEHFFNYSLLQMSIRTVDERII